MSLQPPDFHPARGAFCEATGTPVSAMVEPHRFPDAVDHVWIRIETGGGETLVVAINTYSRKNLRAGFDSRVRVGRFFEGISSGSLPEIGVRKIERYDYAEVESRRNIFYEFMEREDLQMLLVAETGRARMVTAWGDFFLRHNGIHQVHSRRRSCAVDLDVIGRDGGISFYHDDPSGVTTYFFKFCGQP